MTAHDDADNRARLGGSTSRSLLAGAKLADPSAWERMVAIWSSSLLSLASTLLRRAFASSVAVRASTRFFCRMVLRLRKVFGRALSRNQPSSRARTMKLATVTGVRPPSRFGELKLDGKRVVNFAEKPTVGQGLINGGFFIFERGALEYLNNDPQCILEHSALESMAQDGELFVYEHNGCWQCMDTFRDWEYLEKLWQEGTAPWKIWK